MTNTNSILKKDKIITSQAQHQNCIENHLQVAKHHKEAAKHHNEAAKYHKAGDYEKARTSTVIAKGHIFLAGKLMIEDAECYSLFI